MVVLVSHLVTRGSYLAMPKTLIADLHGIGTIGFHGVPPSSGVAVLGDGLFYLLALVCTLGACATA
jgi:hypothetical protein